jgi:hypothetical protein
MLSNMLLPYSKRLLMIEFLQVNLNLTCRVAHDLLRQYVAEHGVDVVLLSEPYSTSTDHSSWIVSNVTRRAAIWITGTGIVASHTYSDPEFVSARLNGVQIFCCYASPNKSQADFDNLL